MLAKRFARWAGLLPLLAATQAVHAAPLWQVNPEGTGPGGAVTVQALNVGGAGFVQIIPDAANPTAFTFIEHGAYQALQADGMTPFGSRDLTITYAVSGSGSFLDPATLRFNAGSVRLFADNAFDFGTATGNYGADNGAALARFAVIGGGVDASGLVNVSAALVGGSLLPGYLFAADGSDLAGTGGVLMNLGVFNQPTQPDSLFVSEIICGLAGYTGPGCNGTPYANSPLAFAVRDGGFVGLSVPEPGSLGISLAGLGLLGFAGRRRHPSAAG